MNGEITFSGDMEMTFDDTATEPGTWRCKTPDELSSACPTNYLVDGAVPDSPPCHDDTIVIQGDSSNQILWVPGQFVQQVTVETADETPNAMVDNSMFNALWAEMVDTQYLGAPPVINAPVAALPPASMCINTCPSLDMSGTISPEDRYSLAGEAELARLDALLTSTREARLAASEVVGSPQMINVLNVIQDQYLLENLPDGVNVNDLAEAAITMPEVNVGGATMAEWLESDPNNGFDPKAINMIKFGTTKAVAERAMGWMNEQVLTDSVTEIWGPIIGADVAGDAVSTLNDGAYEGPSLELGSSVAGVEITSSLEAAPVPGVYTMVEKMSCQTLLAYVNKFSTTANTGPALTPNGLNETFSFVKPNGTTWGKADSAPMQATADYDFAPGAVKFAGMQIKSKVFVSTEGELKSVIAPQVLQFLASSAVVQITLYTEEKMLDAQVSRVSALTTTTTTLPPPAASESEDSEGLPIMIIAAAGAGLLLCIIIVVVLLKMGGGDDGEEKGSVGRGVVSFENPMYDDPAAAGDAPDEDGGLYDEPAFNADGKENPMYTSNENTADEVGGGGYLDVEPDDGEDEDGDDDDSDSEDDE